METKDKNLTLTQTPPLKELSKSAWRAMKISESEEAQNQLTSLHSQLFFCQKTYGEKLDNLEGKDAMWQRLLADQTYHDIQKACVEYCKTNEDMPTPANVIKLIKENNKFKNFKVLQ